MKRKLLYFWIFTLVGGFLAAVGAIIGGVMAHRAGFIPGSLVIAGIGLYFLAYRLQPHNNRLIIGVEAGLILSLVLSPWTLGSPVTAFGGACLIGIGAAATVVEKPSNESD